MAAARDQNRSNLLEQIQRERREVRILESERALLLSRNRKRHKRRRHDDVFPTIHPQSGGGGDGLRSSTKSSSRGDEYVFDGASDNNLTYESSSAYGNTNTSNGEGEQELLDTLDALQCRVTLESMIRPERDEKDVSGHNDGAESLINNSNGAGLVEFDAQAFQLSPIFGGIAFTGVEGPLSLRAESSSSSSSSSAGAKVRTYILSGYVVPSYNIALNESFGFEIRLEISISPVSESNISATTHGKKDEERATVSSLQVKFSPFQTEKSGGEHPTELKYLTAPFPTEELTDLVKLVQKTKSLTQLFRELVSFQEFHSKRAQSIQNLVDEFGEDTIVTNSANIIKLTSRGKTESKGEGLHLKISWSRVFSELGRDDELYVEGCTFPSDEGGTDVGKDQTKELVGTVMDPDGISSLVDCVRSAEGALRVILQALNKT